MFTERYGTIEMADNDSVVDRSSARDRRRIRQKYDWDSTTPSGAVVETVAVVTDTAPTELDRLQDTIDADALDTLVGRGDRDSPLQVGFEYADTEVRVDRDGTVTVTLP